jgi:hypothetical protein
MSLNLMLKESVAKGLEAMFQTNARSVVKMLSVKYGFDLGEALADLAITETVKVVKGKQAKQGEGKEEGEQAKQVKKEKKEKKAKMVVPKMVLPYCGRVVEEWCEGVKKNHGLYSQCTGEKNGEGKYCKACKKQAEANDSGKPTLGNINERMEGAKRVPYAVVLKKLKIEKEEACAEAKKFGLEIPLEEFEMPVSSRGRPKKVSESESMSSDEGEKKRRGRPKKNKTVAANTTDETDDLIASLVAEANALKSASACETEANASASEAEETDAEDAEVDDSACETDACETDACETDSEAEAEVDEILLKKIHEKINADKKFKKMSKMVVEKKERKKHLLAVGEYIKTLLTEEELALYNGPPEEVDIYGSDEEEEASEPVEDEATRKAREAAEKKAQVELEKQQKKEQAEQEKKAKAEEKAREAAEKKAQVELEKQQQAKQKKEQAEQEKKAKQQAAAEKKAQAELEKQQAKPVEAKEKKVAKKKEAKPAEVKPVEAKPAETKPEEAKAVEVKAVEVKPAEKKEKKAQVKQVQVKQAEVKPAEVKPVEKKVEEELLAEAVAEEGQEEGQEETVTAKVFEYEGKKYLKTEEGILYDQATEECVGVWNEETKSIDEFADEED